MTAAKTMHRSAFEEVFANGDRQERERAVAVELPVAIEVNGFGYAVLMATPVNLGDLATGFVLSDRLVDKADDIDDIAIHNTGNGLIIRLAIAPHLTGRIGERLRPRLSDTSCGLCGLENIEQVIRPLPKVNEVSTSTTDAIFRARNALAGHQVINAETGAVHAAALVSNTGEIRLVREDIGRHNALDKLIGAMASAQLQWDGGFALLSSRCSYELVEKAALAHCPLLVTISAPTSLALDCARSAGVRVAVLARDDSFLEYIPN